jgi:transglutaminase-like putative cysteine protease
MAGGGDRPVSSPRHPDRQGLPAWILAALAILSALAMGIAGSTVARGQLTPGLGFLAGATAATLALLGLVSLSVRLIARVVLLVSASLMVRFGLLSGSIATGGQLLLLWLVVGAALFVLTHRVDLQLARPLGGGPTERSLGAAPTFRVVAVVAAVVVLAAVVLTPLLLPYVGEATEAGEGATLDAIETGAGALRSTDSLDMTERPRLSDEVVFTVESDRATFWRGETFDVWDGRRWTRSDGRFESLLPVDRLRTAEGDLGALGDDVVVQRFRMETPYADVVHAAASAVSIEIDRPVRQRPDGTLVSAPLGRGAAYTVTSRREPLTVERLRSAQGSVPAVVAAQYAIAAPTTDRVRDLAQEIAGEAPTTYDAVLALQGWMGERVEYTLDAPLAPKGVDVVDHFLFEAEQGWCEQIASSLVVLARELGIPARLVTGFVPGEQDAVTGRFTVRERDAHAWAEIWFSEVGWVPFDPTADVPLAGDDRSDETVLRWILDRLVVLALGIVVLVLAVGPFRRWAGARLAARAARPTGWAAVTDARLEAIGRRAGRERSPDETATTYGEALARRLGEPALAVVGRLVDDAVFAAAPVADRDRADADAALDRVEAEGGSVALEGVDVGDASRPS